jgi:hypothetical protein
VLDQALAQIPDAHRYGTEILIRSDSAGCTQGFLAHIRSLREQGITTRFSVGVAITEPIREAIRAATDWIPAVDADGDLRDGAQICEITGLVPAGGYPTGTRFIVRRERPHPGAQLSLFDTIEGMRHQVMATDTPPGGGSIQYLEARHRAHARVEDRIRTGKDSGFGRFPSRVFAINQAWLELALVGIDLLAWTRTLLLDGGTPLPSRRSCATGSCTSPPASCGPPAAPSCASPSGGPGPTSWPPRTPASPPCPDRSVDRQAPHHLQGTGASRHRPGGHRTPAIRTG